MLPDRLGHSTLHDADLKVNAQDAARAKQDEKLAKMTPAEKAKWKEKQEKKQMRKSAGKIIMKR